MEDRPLSWQVFPPFIAIVLCAMFAAEWYASHAIRVFHYRQTEQRLEAAAGLVREHLAESGETLDSAKMDAICDTLGKASGYRVTVILPSGRVTGDSEEEPAHMDDHSARPEMRAAMSKGLGCSKRFSDTLGMNMMYVAVAMPGDEKPQAVVRMALSLADVDGTVNKLRLRIVLTGLVLAIMATGLSIMISRRINRTLSRIRAGAESFAAGDLSARLPPSDISEMNLLAQTMNTMAGQLQDRIGDITQQRDEQNALFACMTESVVAVDTERRIIKMNAAAETLFGVNAEDCSGRNIVEVIRNSELHDIVEQALDGTEPAEGDIHLFDRDIHLQAHGTGLHGPGGGKIGGVVVLTDVTRMRRLETMRRDFVANASHELKTPITSVLGFVETLRQGAAEEKADRDRFLEIIHRHAARLKSIVEDLLALARIEYDADREDVELSEGAIAPVLESAAQACRVVSDSKNMRVTIECAADVKAAFDRQLLEQAVTNLLDNAVKYSDAEKRVVVKASETADAVVISVCDEGPGIEKQHVERLFERFYRVDKGRSRNLGGTGLGLAIVKHIATVHGGTVEVQTAQREGSTFFIKLPKRK
jgi:two-component system, OmpR family, phosphate regulon sensor histidine kinase PhoR